MKSDWSMVDETLPNYLRTWMVIRWDREEDEFTEVLDAELAYLRRELLLAYRLQMEAEVEE